MKKIQLLLTVLTAFLAIGTILNSTAQTYNPDWVDGAVYFKFKDNVQVDIPVNPDRTVDLDNAPILDDLREKYSISSLHRPFDIGNDSKLLRTFEVKFTIFEEVDEIMEELAKNEDLEYVEKVAMYYLDYVPNDELYNKVLPTHDFNWFHDRVNSEAAWDITHGSEEINIAIVDGSVWVDHEDLADNIFDSEDVTQPGTQNSNPPTFNSDWSHGTHCAGLAAGVTDNEIGIAGLGFDCSIMGVKCTPDNGQPGQIYQGTAGIQWAAYNGAHVISCSWGSPGYNNSVQNLINTITAPPYNCVVLASAGNDNSTGARYPSWYNGVICVAATQDEDLKSDFSNYGTGVDITAPGGNMSPWLGMISSVCNTTNLGQYDRYQGTSMSTPFAAGLAGLILSLNPNLNPVEVEDIMQDYADDIDPLNPSYAGMLGEGRINAYESVSHTPYEPECDFSTPVRLITPGTEIDYSDLSIGLPNLWDWEFEGGSPYSSSDPSPSITYSTEGTYNAYLYVENDWGYDYVTKIDYITVDATPVPWVVFHSDTNYACATVDAVTFTDESIYNPTSWLWEFEPNTVTFLDGTSASSQNPVVSFGDPGMYSVTLTATNANGDGFLTEENYIEVEGIELNFEEDFESEASEYLLLSSNEGASVRVDEFGAHPDSDFGLHFDGSVPGPWVGSPTSTTPEEAWEENTQFHGFAKNCNVDANGVTGVTLTLDIRQTFSVGYTYSWFRVLVNGEQIPDVYGVTDFNPETNEDPWRTLTFDLSGYGNASFDITLQAATYLEMGFSGTEGDNVFIDNVMISNTTSIDNPETMKASILVYPNPAQDRINYSVSGIGQDYTITMMNVQGKQVFAENVKGNTSQMGRVDVSSMAPGIYILTVASADKVVNKKVIIE